MRRFLYAGLLLVPFILLVGQTSLAFSFITSKAFVFRGLIEILAASWLFGCVADPSLRPKKTPVAWAVAAFCVILAVANAAGIHPAASFWGNLTRMDGWIGIAHLALYFVLLGSVLDTAKRWNTFLECIVWIGGIESILGFVQLAGWMSVNTDAGRLDATFGNASFLASYLALSMLVAALLAIYRWREPASSARRVRLVSYWACIALDLVVLYFTGTRGSLLALIAAIVCMALCGLCLLRGSRMVKWTSAAILGVIAVVAIVFVSVRDQPFVKNSFLLNRFNQVSVFQDQGRYHIWGIALRAFQDHPVLGAGQESFGTYFYRYYDPALYNDESIFDRPHNVFLEWLQAAGIAGLSGYLGMLVSFAYVVWLSRKASFSRPEKIALTGFIVCYVVNGLFLFDVMGTYLVFFGLCAFVHWRASSKASSGGAGTNHLGEPRSVRVSHIAAGSLAGIGLILGLNGSAFAAAASFPYIEPQHTPAQFVRALSYRSYASRDILLRLIEITTNMHDAATSTVPEMTKRAYFDRAVQESASWLRGHPQDAHLLYVSGSLLYAYGVYPVAEELLTRALAISPHKQRILLKLADVYLAEGRYDKMQSVAKETYELAPRYDGACVAYITSLILTGDGAAAEKLMAMRRNLMYADDPIFVWARAERAARVEGQKHIR